ncbi:hypothetical protein ACP70R_049012 [Stipagrostis hirtigluma subsp. patula]
MSTIVMRVDLECEKCYKKIRKVLCKLQDKVSIKMISYDEKSKTVTVSGPFDGEEVADRLTSDAGKVITDIHVAGGNQKHAAKAPKPDKAKGHGNGHGHGQGGGGGGGGGGKPEKKHVKFDFDDMDDDFDFEPAGKNAHGHHGHSNNKPKIVTTTAAAARLEAPRTGPSMSMATAAPVRMPPAMTPQPQVTTVPSIWPPAPEWGYSAPQYGGWGGAGAGGPPAGGYYGGPPAYGHRGYAPYGYGRNPYGQQYYDEEPSAGCSIM